MNNRVQLHRFLILTVLVILPIIASAQWEYETVTTGGYRNAIAVDSNGNPHISYSNNTIGHHL